MLLLYERTMVYILKVYRAIVSTHSKILSYMSVSLCSDTETCREVFSRVLLGTQAFATREDDSAIDTFA